MEYSERQKKIGFIQVMLAGALWGTTGTITKYIYAYGVDPLSLGLLRISISFVLLYLYALLTGKRVHLEKEHILFFLAFGAISVASFNLLYLTAIQLTTVTTSVVLLYTAPAFTMVAARLILNESVTRRKLITLALTFTGILLVVEANLPGQLQLNIPGVLTGLGAGLTYGVYSIFSKAALKRGYGTLETVILALGSGLIFILFVKPPWHLATLAGEPFILWVLVIAVAVFSTMLAYVFFVTGLVHVEAGKATLITAIEPVVAITMAMIFLGETMTLLQFLGVLAVLTAVISQK